MAMASTNPGPAEPGSRPRVVIVGGGFAGHSAARSLVKRVGDTAEIVLINPTDYFLYLPLLPEVAAGVLEPRRVTVPLAATLPGVRVVLGEVDAVDLAERRVGWSDPEGGRHELGYDRLVLAAGSVNKLLPIPGVAEHAHGFRGIPEALYLRDHVTRQIELAAATDDPREREARCTFVVVGAGYTGTEVAAQGPLFTDALVRQHATLRGQRVRWLLLDLAERVLPELDVRLSRTADRVLPDPLVEEVELPTQKGRLVVDAQLTVPGHPDLFACGDAAAVPDLTRPGEVTAMTAQHAVRQGKLAARNVAASLGPGTPLRYRHHDLGFVLELGGHDAAANPLHVPLSGLVAKAVTRGYHLLSMPTNRTRTAADWLLDAVLPRQTVQLGLVRAPNVPLETASPELERTPR